MNLSTVGGVIVGGIFGVISNVGGNLVLGSLCCHCIPILNSAGGIGAAALLMNSLEDSAFATGMKVGIFVTTMLLSPCRPIYADRYRSEKDQRELLLGSFIAGSAVGILGVHTIGPMAGLILGGTAGAVIGSIPSEQSHQITTRR